MDTVVVYSDIGDDGTVTLLDRYESDLPSIGQQTEVLERYGP